MSNDILDETKRFKDQITVKILSKHTKALKLNFLQFFFDLTTKTMINHKFDLEKVFQEILYSIEICVNERFD